MKNAKSKTMLFVLFLYLSGCANSLVGTLTVNRDLTIVESNLHRETITQGDYVAEVKYVNDGGNLVMDYQSQFTAGKVRLKLNNLPRYLDLGGNFYLEGNQINQGWDLIGEVTIEKESSEPITMSEFCPDNSSSRTFWREDQPLGWATREVQYHVESETKYVYLQFLEENTRVVLAEFEANNTTNKKIYDELGVCF